MLRFSAAVAVVLIAAGTEARAHKSSAWANVQFTTAVRLQETLESQPVTDRTRRDYQHVISAYQRVYAESPTSSKADPSVMASGELLEEMGRQFKDEQVLQSAIERYRFLREQYPGSKARFDALFRIAEIYRDDLRDKAKADDAFQEFLKRYPANPLAAEAKKQLAEPIQQAATRKREPIGPPLAVKQSNTESDDPSDSSDTSASADAAKPSNADDRNPAGVTRVLGIRHWSTPNYTRVAIDLEQSVKYQAQRIENPDRIFFDLYGTRLDRALYGKSFDVDDGFLKKIRVAQFKSERTRVVLDLDELTDYRATLQANPPRLIIDIRNKHLGNDAPEKPLIAVNAEPVDDRAASRPAVAQPDAATKHASAPDPNSDCDSSDCDSAPLVTNSAPANPPIVRRAIAQPSKRVVIGKDGVKKTIVDADDDATTVAKLDPPPLPSPPATATDDSAPAPRTAKTHSSKGKHSPPLDDPETREAQPTANGDRSLIRALGLKIGKIVIDPGHGGHDTGTVGPNGLEEKDLVLDVSLRLGKLLASRLGAQVVYTRKDDTFIPLEDRTAIANQEGADLFVSVHANSSHDEDARGVETYYLNFTSSPEALEVAARENAVSEKSIHELQDILKKIALKEKIEESHEFASDVQTALYSGLAAKSPGLRNRGVKKAPFIVLIGANMPSILAEISFVSNPGDEKKLKTPEYRQKIAESLYRGVSKYVSGLSGVKVASKIDKGEGQ
jgi:N-acetylmuramoyl-L-alanine amidase